MTPFFLPPVSLPFSLACSAEIRCRRPCSVVYWEQAFSDCSTSFQKESGSARGILSSEVFLALVFAPSYNQIKFKIKEVLFRKFCQGQNMTNGAINNPCLILTYKFFYLVATVNH